MTRVQQLWRSVGSFPDDLSSLTASQADFLRWIEASWKHGLWSARQATTPTGRTHRNARRMMNRLEELGILERWK